MKKLLIIIIPLIILIFMFGLFNKNTGSSKPDDDTIILDQLAQAGSDLSREHSIDMYLYFPDEKSARLADEIIKSRYPDLVTDIHQLEGVEDWTLAYKATFVPELKTMQEIRTFFNEVSTDLNGDYDGWGATITE